MTPNGSGEVPDGVRDETGSDEGKPADGVRGETGSEGKQPSRFTRRVWLAVGIVALVFLLVGLVWYALELVLVIFAGILMGVLLGGITHWIKRFLPRWMPRVVVVATFVLLVLGGVVLAATLAGPRFVEQFQALMGELSRFEQQATSWLEGHPVGVWVLERVRGGGQSASMSTLLGGLRGVFSSIITLVGTSIIVVFFGIYFAIDPEAYLRGILTLAPPYKRPELRLLLDEIGRALRSWLVGRFLSMLIVCVGTSVGLYFVGVPMAVLLGFIAGALSFIPNLGPILAAAPGLAVAFGQDPMTAVWALCVYVGVQAVESYLVTPFIEQKSVSLPPALLLGVQVLLGGLGGVMGLFLATPLAVAVIVIVQFVYVRGVLHDPVVLLGQK